MKVGKSNASYPSKEMQAAQASFGQWHARSEHLLRCVVTISDALHYARRLCLHFRNPDAFMYNTLIRGLAESDTPHNALVVYAEMRRRLTDPIDSFSFAFVLKAAANCGLQEMGCSCIVKLWLVGLIPIFLLGQF
ncbi:hypothetical protein ACFX15_038511 [Malus domestica]